MSLRRVRENPPCSPQTQDSNPEPAAVLAKDIRNAHFCVWCLTANARAEPPHPDPGKAPSLEPAPGRGYSEALPRSRSRSRSRLPALPAGPRRAARSRLRETGDNSNGGLSRRPPRPVVHRGAKMAAPSEGRPGRGASPFPGTESGPFAFPFAVPHGAAGSGAEESSKKPCRACTDFKSWLREQRKRAAPGGGVRRRLSRGGGGGGGGGSLPCHPRAAVVPLQSCEVILYLTLYLPPPCVAPSSGCEGARGRVPALWGYERGLHLLPTGCEGGLSHLPPAEGVTGLSPPSSRPPNRVQRGRFPTKHTTLSPAPGPDGCGGERATAGLSPRQRAAGPQHLGVPAHHGSVLPRPPHRCPAEGDEGVHQPLLQVLSLRALC